MSDRESSFFRQKPQDAVPHGQDQIAVDANPSELSGGTRPPVAAPVWKAFVQNANYQEANRAGIAAEQSQIRQSAAAGTSDIFKGVNGRLIHKARGQKPVEYDANDWVDDPEAGPEARKSLWDREIRSAREEAELTSLELANPAFQARELPQKDREAYEAEGSMLQETDPRHAELKSKLVADTEYQTQKQEMAQRAWNAKARAAQTEAMDPESWWQQRQAQPAPTPTEQRQATVQAAQTTQAQAQAADDSSAADLKAIEGKLMGGVTAEESKALQAQRAEILATRPKIAEIATGAAKRVEGVQAEAAAKVPEKDFFQFGDAVAGIWDAVKGLGTTAPAAFYQLMEGMERPDQYSESAKAAFAEADAFNKEMQAKTAANQAAGTSSSVGESFREAGGSLGFSLGSMAAAIPASMAGAKAGAVTGAGVAAIAGLAGPQALAPEEVVTVPVGAATGALIGGVSAGMAASGTAAYRMAGASFLNETFNAGLKEYETVHGGSMPEAERKALYDALLPVAKNTALWEAGPEAVGNAFMMGAGKIILGSTAKKIAAEAAKAVPGLTVKRIAAIQAGKVVGSTAEREAIGAATKQVGSKFLNTKLGKLTAGLADFPVEIATEAATQVEQNADQQKGDLIARGEDASGIKADWSVGGMAEAIKEVTPQTAALMFLMGGGAASVKGTYVAGKKVFGKDYKKDNPRAPEALTAVNTGIAAIDPEAAPATSDEMHNAAFIARDTDGPSEMAEAIIIQRELAAIEAEDAGILPAAQEALAQAQASGDKGAIKVAETALEQATLAPQRAPLVTATLKIAAGKQLNQLTAEELTAVGYESKPGKEGEINFTPIKQATGKGKAPAVAPMIRQGADGSIILTDAALKAVAATSPRASARVAMAESEAIEKANARALAAQQVSTDSQNGTQRDSATGSTPPGGGTMGSPIETNAAVEFDVPMRDGTTLRVQAPNGAEALRVAAGTSDTSIIAGTPAVQVTPTPTTNESNSSGTTSANGNAQSVTGEKSGGTNQGDAEIVGSEGEAGAKTVSKPTATQAKAEIILSEHGDGRIKALDENILTVAKDTGMKVTKATTLQQVIDHLEAKFPTVKIENVDPATIKRVTLLVNQTVAGYLQNPAVRDVLKLDQPGRSKAESSEDGVFITKKLMVEALAKAGLSNPDAKIYMDRVLFEELHHLSQLQTFREIFARLYPNEDTRPVYENWLTEYSRTLIEEFKAAKYDALNEKGETIKVSFYDKALEAYGAKLAFEQPHLQVAEINRMILQDMMTGNPTEATMAALSSPSVREFITAAIATLKKFVADFRANPSKFSKDLIENMDRVEQLLQQYDLATLTQTNPPQSVATTRNTPNTQGAGNSDNERGENRVLVFRQDPLVGERSIKSKESNSTTTTVNDEQLTGTPVASTPNAGNRPEKQNRRSADAGAAQPAEENRAGEPASSGGTQPGGRDPSVPSAWTGKRVSFVRAGETLTGWAKQFDRPQGPFIQVKLDKATADGVPTIGFFLNEMTNRGAPITGFEEIDAKPDKTSDTNSPLTPASQATAGESADTSGDTSSSIPLNSQQDIADFVESLKQRLGADFNFATHQTRIGFAETTVNPSGTFGGPGGLNAMTYLADGSHIAGQINAVNGSGLGNNHKGSDAVVILAVPKELGLKQERVDGELLDRAMEGRKGYTKDGRSGLPNTYVVGHFANGAFHYNPNFTGMDPVSEISDPVISETGPELKQEGVTAESIEADYQSALRHADSWGKTDPEIAGKKRKAAGMQRAAAMRQLTGNLTAKEQQAKDAYEASNYTGKPVSVDGKNGKVTGVSFGRVSVKFEDGTKTSFEADQIAPPVAVAETPVDENQSPLLSTDVTQTERDSYEKTRQQAVAGVYQLSPEERELAHIRLEGILKKKGKLEWSDMLVDHQNKIGTSEASALKQAMATDPQAVLDALIPAQNEATPPAEESTVVEDAAPTGQSDAEVAANTQNINFPSRKAAMDWMRISGIRDGKLTKIDTELFSLEVPKGDYPLPKAWYQLEGEMRFTDPSDPDYGFGLSGPYSRQYAMDMEGWTLAEAKKKEKGETASQTETPAKIDEAAEVPAEQDAAGEADSRIDRRGIKRRLASFTVDVEHLREVITISKDLAEKAWKSKRNGLIQDPVLNNDEKQKLIQLGDSIIAASNTPPIETVTAPASPNSLQRLKSEVADHNDRMTKHVAHGETVSKMFAQRQKGGKTAPSKEDYEKEWNAYNKEEDALKKMSFMPFFELAKDAGVTVNKVKGFRLEIQDQPEPITEVTAPAAETKAAKAVAKKPDTNVKKLKAQKEYLLAALDKAIEEAPEKNERGAWDTEDSGKDHENAASYPNVAILEELFKKYGVAVTNPDKPITWFDNRKPLREAIFEKHWIPSEHPRMVEISVPGDGTFRIVNDKATLKDFRKNANTRFPTNSGAASVPSTSTPGATNIAKIGAPATNREFIAIAGMFVSTDPQREVLHVVQSDGKNLVATNGRQVMVIKRSVGGSEEKPVYFEAKTQKGAKLEGTYPGWKQVIPREFTDEVEIDTAAVQKIVIQAKAIASKEDGQRTLMIWKDDAGKMGYTLESEPDNDYLGGMFAGGEANPETAKFVTALNVFYFLDGLKAMRLLGHEKVTMKVSDVSTMLEADGAQYVQAAVTVEAYSHPLSQAEDARLAAMPVEEPKIDASSEEAVPMLGTVGETKQEAPAESPAAPAKVPTVGRFRPKTLVEFKKPITGPSGAKLAAYEWKYRLEEGVDKRGEDSAVRVSNWNESMTNDATGREVVHQFHVETADGKGQVVSLESALELLGYVGKDSAGSTMVKSLASVVKNRAKNLMELQPLEAELAEVNKWQDAYDKARRNVDTRKMPEMMVDIDDKNQRAWGRGEFMLDRYFPGVMANPSEYDLRQFAERTREGWIDMEAKKVAGKSPQTTSDLQSKITDLKRRIKKMDTKIDQIGLQAAEAQTDPDESPADLAERKRDEEAERRSKQLGIMFGPHFENMLTSARNLWKTEKEWRYNALLRLRENITTLLIGFTDSTPQAEKIATDMIEGKPTIIDKVLAYKPIKESELKAIGSRPSAIIRLGYERGDRAVYSHPKGEAVVKPSKPGEVEYRGFKITKSDGVQLGYRTNNGGFGKGRKSNGYDITDEEGTTIKFVSTIKEAKEYLDSYMGDSTPAAQEPAPSPSSPEFKALPVEEKKRVLKDRQEAKQEGETLPITSLDSLMAFFQRIRKGETTAAEIKSQWETFKAIESEIRKEVAKMTMKELERFQGMRKPDNKADAVRMAMDALHGEFRPGAMFSYGGTIGNRDKMNEAKAAAQEKAVAAWTDETIQANAQERRDKADARTKALENPETLDEWKQFVRRKGLTGLSLEEIKAFNAVRSPYDLEPKIMARGEGRLTPEQLAAYDEVRGIDRKAEAQARKEREATVRGVKADTDSEIVETKHTKTGADLFVVKLADRVERDVYTSLNTAAKKLGGYYSSYRGTGAVPGFQFKDRATAEQFQAITKGETVDRSEAVQERQSERKNAAAEKLAALADKMDEAADKVLSADRKTNTAKRAREAGYAESGANSMKAMATTMRNLADAIESGEATHLDGVRSRTHVETLMSLSNRAKTDAENSENLSYSERENRKGENPTADQIAKAKYPYPFLNETAWQWLIQNGNNTPGAKRLTARLEKVFASKPSAQANGSYITGAEMIGVVKELLGKINRQDYTRKNIEGAFENYDRVQAMGLTDLPSLRAALREFLQYRGTKAKADPIKAMERDLVGMKLPGFFPTPQTVIEEMLDRVGDLEGKHVLEPSAGKGDIADAARAAGADVEVIEQQSRLRDILESRGHRVIEWNFMDADPKTRGFTFGDVFQNKDNTKGIMRGQGGMGSDRVRLVREDGTEIGKYNRSELEGIERRGSNSGYDAVLMNPPFEDGQDGEHVMRAFQFLKPGGKLVAITGEGIFGRSDKKSQAFRDWLDSVGGTSEKLPEGSFKSAFRPTGVNTRIVVIEKPATSLRAAGLPAKIQPGSPEWRAMSKADRIAYLTKRKTMLQIASAINSELSPEDKAAAAKELGETDWNDAARDSFIARMADWLVSGIEASAKLAAMFAKVAKNAALSIVAAISIANTTNTEAISVRSVAEDMQEVPAARPKPMDLKPAIDRAKAAVDSLRMPDVSPVMDSASKAVDAIRETLESRRARGNVEIMADWVKSKDDNRGKPFAIADKSAGMVRFFDSSGNETAEIPALFGRRAGDEVKMQGVSHRTPAGRFDAEPYDSQDYGPTVRFNRVGNNNFLIHRVPSHSVTAPPAQRKAALQSSTPDDNRITSGCINIDRKMVPQVTEHFDKGGVVYVLPETESGKGLFEGFEGLRASTLPPAQTPFYSLLERTVEAKIPARATPEQIMATVRAVGVKAEEIKWSGIEQALPSLAVDGKVSKDALLKYLADEGSVRFEEVTLGDKPPRWKVSDANETEYFDTEEEANDAADEWRSYLASEIEKREIVKVGEGWSVSERDEEYGGSAWAIYDSNDQQQEVFDTEEEANERLEELNGMYAIQSLNDDYWTADPDDSYESENEAEEARDSEDNAELEDYVSVQEDDSGNDPNAPLFAQYVLPGGENYREVVLAMAEVDTSVDAAKEHSRFLAEMAAKYGGMGEMWSKMTDSEMGRSEYLEAEAFQGKQSDTRKKSKEVNYTSSHFPDVPNYVAHMRVNDRDGGLFIEEIQSDRHQAGRKQGYANPERDAEIEAERNRLEDEKEAAFKARQRNLTPETDAAFRAAADAVIAFKNLSKPERGIAPAPFEKTWPLALFKRALRDAVAGEKDWIGWTDGETQKKRFDLSAQLQTLSTFNNGKGGWDISGRAKGSNELKDIASNVSTEKLPDYIGKDMAERVVAAQPDKGWKEYSGIDLKVGGNGMKGFYDNMLPKEIGKYVKQWGGKVETSELLLAKGMPLNSIMEKFLGTDWGKSTQEQKDLANSMKNGEKGVPIWKIPITPEMKAGVSAGQALYSSTLPPFSRPQGTLIQSIISDFSKTSSQLTFKPSNETDPTIRRIAQEQGIELVDSEDLRDSQRRFEERTGARPVFFTGGNPETKGFVEASAPSLIFVSVDPANKESIAWTLIHELIHVSQRDSNAKAQEAYEGIIDKHIDDKVYFALQKVLLDAGYQPGEIADEIQAYVFTDVVTGKSELRLNQLPNYGEIRDAVFAYVNGLSGLNPRIIKPTIFSKDLTQDAEYLALAKDPEKNREALQKMVDDAAKKAMPESHARRTGAAETWLPYQHEPKKPLFKLYHGGEKGITSFAKSNDRPDSAYKQGNLNSQGIWLTSSRGKEGEIAEIMASSDAATYAANYEGGGQIYDLFADIKNPKMMGQRDTAYITAQELRDQGYDGAYLIDSGFWIALDPSQVKSADPVTYDASGNVIPLSQRFNPAKDSILYAGSMPTPEAATPEPSPVFRYKVPVNQAMIDEAEGQVKALGHGSAGADPKFANHGSTPNARDFFDITRMIDSSHRPVRKDEDVHRQGREYLAKYPEEVKRLILEGAMSTHAEFIHDYKQHAIKLYLDSQAKNAFGDKDMKEAYDLSTAYIMAGREQALAFRQRHDLYMTQVERNLSAINEAIFSPKMPFIEQLSAIDNPKERKAFMDAASERRIKEVRATLKQELGLQLEDVTGRLRTMQLANSRLEKELMKTRNVIERDIIKYIRNGAGPKEIKAVFGKDGVEMARAAEAKLYADFEAKIRPMVEAGMTDEDILKLYTEESLKAGSLNAGTLTPESPITPEQIKARIKALYEKQLGISRDWESRKPLPSIKQPKPPLTEAEMEKEEVDSGNKIAQSIIDRITKNRATPPAAKNVNPIRELVSRHTRKKVTGFRRQMAELGVSKEMIEKLDAEITTERLRNLEMRKNRQPKPIKTSPVEADWSRPEFEDGLKDVTFDTTDRSNIMAAVETIRSLAQAVGSIERLEGKQRGEADAALAKVNSILAKYGTNAEEIFESGKPIAKYHFDPSDQAQMAAVIRVINAMEADWIDKGLEWSYGAMLSGTQTAAVNMGSGLHGVHSALIGRAVETVINSFVNDPMSAQWGEWKYVIRAVAPGWSRAWSNMIGTWKSQHPMVERDMLAMEVDWEAHLGGALNQTKTGVISGLKGDIIRMPMRGLSAVDDFNKTLFGMAEAAAFAYRLAVVDSQNSKSPNFGMKPGDAKFERFVRIEMNTPGSMSMKLGVNKAARFIFAEALPGQKDYTGQVKQVRDIGDIVGKGAAALNRFATSNDQSNMAAKFFQAFLRMSFFPFQRTPFNIIRQAARYTPNPISIVDITLAAFDNISAKNESTGKREYGWNMKHRGPEIIERMSQQLQGAAAMMILMAIGAGEGDEDDDKKFFLMTGSQPYSPTRRAEIDARRRAGVEAYRLSLRRKDGSEIAGMSYGRIEPYATAWSAVIDTLAAWKRGTRAGQDMSGIAANTLGSLVDQSKEKTFLSGLGDLVGMIENLRASEEYKEPADRKLKQFIVGRIAMLLPNIIRQPIREFDTNYREKTDSYFKELMYQLFPYGQKEAMIDPYGDEETKRGTSAGRMFDALDIGTKNDFNQIDKMLIKWRDSGRWSQAPDEADRRPWFPSRISNATFKHPITGQTVKMDESQLAEFREKAGKATAAKLKGLSLNFENPSSLDIAKVRNAVTDSRRLMKDALRHKFSKTTK